MLLDTVGHTARIGNHLASISADYFRGVIFLNDCQFKALDPAMEAINWTPYNYTEVKYYRNSEERKICLPDQLDNLRKVRELTGQAWYYMLDRSEERFKLPYSDNFIRWSNGDVGNYNEDMSRDFVIHAMAADNIFSGYDKTFSRTENNLVFPEENRENKGNFAVGSYIADKDWESLVARMSNKFNTGDQVSPRTNNFYLYFYLGEVVVNEASVDINGLTDALANKMDSDFSNSVVGFDPVVDYKIPTDEDPRWYRLYKSGWIEQGGIRFRNDDTASNGIKTIELIKNMADSLYYIDIQHCELWSTNNVLWQYHTVSNITNESFQIQVGDNDFDTRWQVKGQVYKGE